jgi:GYF domain 2
MRDGWYYADGETPVGPMTLDALVLHLLADSAPDKVRVWHFDLPDWQAAKDVPQVAARVFKPLPPEPRLAAPPAAEPRAAPAPRAKRSRGGALALLVALAFVLAVGAVVFTLSYGKSTRGLFYLAGQLGGVTLILWLLTWRWRSSYRGAVVLAVAGLVVTLGHARALRDHIAVADGKAILQGVRDAAGIQQAAERNPSNVMLQLLAAATREAQESERLAQQLWDEIDAPFARDVDYASPNRADLEAHHRDLLAAEAAARAALPRFASLYADERKKVETFARSLRVDQATLRDLLTGVDNRHARITALIAKMLPARADVFRSVANPLAIAIEQFGSYKVEADGQLVFQRQADADRFNTAVAEVDAAARRMSELDDEAKKLAQAQQEGWDRFVAGR